MGKTTLAKIVATQLERPFFTLSAVTSGVKDVREVIESARKQRFFDQKAPLLFIDEIHRFNKSQQDSLLGAVEQGVVTLIGAIPLGLIISFGSMSNWAPLGFLRPLLKNLPKNTKLTWWQRFQIWCYVDFKPIRIIVRFIIWVVRGTPLMLQLLVFYYFPGLVLGKNIWGGGEAGRFLASSIAFIFNYACYFSEIFRGGIQGVPKGQQEAGQVLGMTNRQIFFKVTLLQMVKRIVPPMSNEIITLVKDTSLSRIIALQEIIWAGQAFLKGSQGISGAIWPLFFTGIYYLLFSGVLQLLLDGLEKKLDYFKA